MLHKRLLPLVLPLFVLAVLCTGPTLHAGSPPASNAASEADLQGFEAGLDLLAGGQARKAEKAFAAVKTPLGEIGEALAPLYRGVNLPQAAAQLTKAVEIAQSGKVPPAAFQQAIAAARGRIDGPEVEDAGSVRALVCHLKLLSGETSDLTEMARSAVQLEERPEFVYQTSIPYTAEARKARYQGQTLHDVLFDAEGCARSVRVAEGGAPFGLDASILENARWWVVEPAEVDGEPVPSYFRYTTYFQLQ